MKDKILFWIDIDFWHFLIAKGIQDQYECDIFSIIDVLDNQRLFFKNQQIVKFAKTWYMEHPEPTKRPDIDYLMNFEKKYGINLWKLAYSERIFYQYDLYHKFSYNEILSILEKECRFFEKILEELQPNFLAIKLTDWHDGHLLCEMCRSKGIKILMFVSSRLGNKWRISDELDKTDFIDSFLTNNSFKKRSLDELKKYLKDYDPSICMNELSTSDKPPIYKWKRLRKILRYYSPWNEYNTNHFTTYGKTKLRVFLKSKKLSSMAKRTENFINKNLERELDANEKFVYFPLHVDPERTMLIGAPFYADQPYIVECIAKSLPVGYKLYVKDHPGQALENWRDLSYYKRIMNLPNVKLLHHSISQEELLAKCSLIITVSGTAGLEAAFNNKHAITFADQDFSHFISSVHRIISMDELPKMIQSYIDKPADLDGLSKYVDVIEQDSFVFYNEKIRKDFFTNYYSGNYLIDEEIAISQIESFLQKYKEEFYKLALHHVEKIKQYKKYEIKNQSSFPN